MLTPLLTEADPLHSSEGSIDPLGLYTIADRLAMSLVPGVRERMAHARFLTATAVSLAVCGEFDEDVIAADGISEPWQVFEWYLVEGMVRTCKDSAAIQGLPGREKVASAIRHRVPLSASRYLKTARVFPHEVTDRTRRRDFLEAGLARKEVVRDEDGKPVRRIRARWKEATAQDADRDGGRGGTSDRPARTAHDVGYEPGPGRPGPGGGPDDHASCALPDDAQALHDARTHRHTQGGGTASRVDPGVGNRDGDRRHGTGRPRRV